MNASPTTYKIIYNNKDITRDISDHLISLSYTDKVENESDELEITVDDKDGLWQNAWYPQKGATIEAEIISDGLVLPCGKFTIDEINLSGSRDGGDAITISCLAAAITKKLRTKKSTSFENTTLKQVAQSVATLHSLTVQGSIPNLRFNRITQNRESDLSFLNRIAKQYGLVFSVRDDKLIFEEQKQLESKAHVLSIDKTDCTDFSFTDKNEQTANAATVKYHNPQTNQTIEHSEEADAEYTGGDDDIQIRERVENKQQAEQVAKTKLRRANTQEKTGSISLPGNILLLSGSNVEVTGFGIISGIFHITEASHTISRDGYTVSFDGKKVNKISPAKYKPKRKAKNSHKASATNAGTVQTAPIGTPDWVTRTFTNN